MINHDIRNRAKDLKILSDSGCYNYGKLKTQLKLELKRTISFSEFDQLLSVLENKRLIEKKRKYIYYGGVILLETLQKLEELLTSYEELRREIWNSPY